MSKNGDRYQIPRSLRGGTPHVPMVRKPVLGTTRVARVMMNQAPSVLAWQISQSMKHDFAHLNITPLHWSWELIKEGDLFMAPNEERRKATMDLVELTLHGEVLAPQDDA